MEISQELDRWRQASEPRVASRDKVGGRKRSLFSYRAPGSSSCSTPEPGPRKGRTWPQREALSAGARRASCLPWAAAIAHGFNREIQAAPQNSPASGSRGKLGADTRAGARRGRGGRGRVLRRGAQGVSCLLLLLRQDRAWLFQLRKTIFLTSGCGSALRKHFVYIQTGSL